MLMHDHRSLQDALATADVTSQPAIHVAFNGDDVRLKIQAATVPPLSYTPVHAMTSAMSCYWFLFASDDPQWLSCQAPPCIVLSPH